MASAGADAASIIVLNSAAVVLNGRRVLADVTWQLQPHQHWAVFGSNGSGKTTLLRLMSGRQWPGADRRDQRFYDFGAGDEGDAVNARLRLRIATPEDHDRYIRRRWNPFGRTFLATGFSDSPILRHRLTREQNTAMGRIVDQLQLAKFLDRRVLSLSRGELRMLMVARAAISAPRVLFLDEICDGLDLSARLRLLKFIDQLAKEGRQIVFATHRPDELPDCMTHFLSMDGGRVSASGDIQSHVVDDFSPVVRSVLKVTRSRPLISIRHANVYRGLRKVLDSLNWDLQPDENWLLTGANGSGKSTLIKLLYAELRPASGGSIHWFDFVNPVNVWELRRRLGLISDELQGKYGDDISVRQCIATGIVASIGRVPSLTSEERQQIADVIYRLKLRSIADEPISKLSYGQFRRVLLGRAIVLQPDLLLLDEPMSGLDAETSRLVWTELQKLSAGGTRLVLATHDKRIPAGLFTQELRLSAGAATIKQLADD